MKTCCNFEGLDEDDDVGVACRYRAVEFIAGEYLSILEGGGYNLIYEHDRRWAKVGDEFEHAEEVDANDATWSATDVIEDASGKITKAAIWRNIIQYSDMCGFDQITALSEASINHNFASLARTQTILERWKHKEEEYATLAFKPPTVRLRSDGRALMTFHLTHGSVKALKNRKPYPAYVLIVLVAGIS